LDRDRNNNIFSSLTKRKTEEKEHYHPLTFHPSSLICTIYLHHKTDPFSSILLRISEKKHMRLRMN